MMTSDTHGLLQRVEEGDTSAVEELLARHRGRLRKMVAARIDPRLSARVDPSDVVQEALVEASRKLPNFAAQRPIPFYPGLRQIAWERLVHLQRRHVETQKRSVQREMQCDWGLSAGSALQLADRFVSENSGPTDRLLRRELQDRVRAAMTRLGGNDLEVLSLWYLEQLSVGDIAAILQLTEAGVKSRHRRAIERLSLILAEDNSEDIT